MTASAAGIVLSSLKPPFAWASLDWRGETIVRGRPFSVDTVLRNDSVAVSSPRLVGMATRAIDDGFIQLLADPRSDLRVLVLYSDKGRRSRVTTVGVSLGFLDFNLDRGHMLALRRTNMSELVTYSLHRPKQ